jgi:hypothetical protein
MLLGAVVLAPINLVGGKTLCRVWYKKLKKNAKTSIWAWKVERSGHCCWGFFNLHAKCVCIHATKIQQQAALVEPKSGAEV